MVATSGDAGVNECNGGGFRRFRWPIGAALVLLPLLGAINPSTGAVDRTAAALTHLTGALRNWVDKRDLGGMAYAVLNDSTVVKAGGFRGNDPRVPARLASLSKAITAVCVARLVDQGRLSFTTRLGTVLARTFQRLGQPVDPRFKSITIEQLLRHRAGLAREAIKGRSAHDMAQHFQRAIRTPLDDNPGGEMSYSNIGYLTLGMVVEAVTGVDYERQCSTTALAPMQAAGSIDPELRQRAPNGGWTVSPIDYGKFVQVFDPRTRLLGAASRNWMFAHTENPAYTFGTYMERTVNGYRFYHSGKVASKEDRGGSYTLKHDNGWTAVVTFDGRGSTELRKILATLGNL